MSYTVSDLKEDLIGPLHGTTLKSVVGLDLLINRSARKLLNDIDPIETIRIQQISSPLFNNVFDYVCPADLKDDRIIDVRPQVNRTLSDRFFQTYNEDFDLSKYALTPVNFSQISVQYNTGIKTLRIDKNLTPAALVNNVDSISNDSGTWAVGGTASNLTLDTLNYVGGSGSLRFDVSAGADPSTGYLENSTMTPVDLTSQENQGALFLWAWIPDHTEVESFTIRWGSSASDYWTKTVVTAQNATAFQDGWNLLRFDWSSATSVGSPDASSTTYSRLSVTYNGSVGSDYRFNQLTAQLGTVYEIEYYSKFIFRDSITGAFQENVTDDSNVINLDTTSFNMLFNLVAYMATQQIQTADGVFDYKFFLDEYNKERMRYVAKIRSQVIQPQQKYYQMPTQRITWIREGY